MGDFSLTMCEAPADRRAYQYRYRFEQTWRGLTAAQLTEWLNSMATYPDDELAKIAAGATVVLRDLVIRRRPTAAEECDAARQIGLFG